MKVIFLDRDETINVDSGYINSPKNIKLKKNTIEGLSLLKDFGYKFIVVSNQSGIGRKIISKKQLKKVNSKIFSLLNKGHIKIKDTFICPHLPEDNCNCRKPKNGLILQAIKKYKRKNPINLEKSYIIGDRIRDISCAEKQNISGILLDKAVPEIKPSNLIHQCNDLQEVAEFILEKEFNQQWEAKTCYDYKNQDFETKINKKIKNLKKQNKKIIFTNGCFDILHPGHIQYLKQAKKLGDILIVGLNSDKSVKKLKGNNRPINNIADRLLMLASYKFIDFVIGFNNDTPIELINKIQPDIHIKGGDYKKKDLPEYKIIKEYGGKIIILPFRKGYSTSLLIKQIEE